MLAHFAYCIYFIFRPEVEFCGYNVPHPLEDKILVRLQTKNGVSAAEMFVRGLEELLIVFGTIKEKFLASYEAFSGS
ncbi:unnamed protein product [Thelazia callipaeda]|uniref:DNA-directed RNA polymerase RBP11-like dimerisation domain-containing protein n=1 Tax=Thelazia callipaeda TaxID=103827 RepID=A0A3P7MHY0_THECL|nr:unnamed protein product [Thelazia callipaeda]